MKLLCLDGNSIINRAFYGVKLLTTKDGNYTNAVFGFMNIFLKLLSTEKPNAVAIAFDLKDKTFRHDKFSGYKAQRKGMPEELAQQMPVIKELLVALGYSIVSYSGYEADDILGTFAKACRLTNNSCVIATGDRDGQQLVSPEIKLLLTTSKNGAADTVLVSEEYIFEKYGLKPPQLIDVKALMGDASDNIPGVAGVGEVTALRLIKTFGSLDEIYAQIDSPEIKEALRIKLIDHKETAYLSKELATIFCDVPIDLQLSSYIPKEPDKAQAAAILRRLEMKSLLEKLSLDTLPIREKPVRTKAQTQIVQSVFSGQEQALYIFYDKENFFFSNETGFQVLQKDDEMVKNLFQSNAKKYLFDAKEFYKHCILNEITLRNVVFDAKLAAYLLNPSAKQYLLSELICDYNIYSDFTASMPLVCEFIGLCSELQKQIEKTGMNSLLQDIELPLCEVLADMEAVGFLVDIEGIRAFGTELNEEIDRLVNDIYSGIGYEFNINSPKQLGVALFDKLELPTRKKTKSGYSTDAETLESLEKYHPVVASILKYRSYQKLNSTYVEGLLKAVSSNNRIHSTFNQTETRTGRISSGEPNLQNIPIRTELGSRMRRFFIAGDGNLLLDADYSQIELRILAALSEDKNMINAFIAGEDIHRTTAAKVFDLPPIMITSQMRNSAKAVNFGIVYGIGAFSLGRDIGVSQKEADGFIKNYLEQFSGVKKFLDRTVKEGHKHNFVTTHFGRRRLLPELASSNKNIQHLGERMAMNTPIQGTAADIIKLAMVRVFRALKENGMRAKLILQVHDELIIEAPIEEVKKASAILEYEMKNACKLSVPLIAEVSSGENWLSAKG